MELAVDPKVAERYMECYPCDLFIEGNNTRHLHHHIEWYINLNTEKQNVQGQEHSVRKAYRNGI